MKLTLVISCLAITAAADKTVAYHTTMSMDGMASMAMSMTTVVPDSDTSSFNSALTVSAAANGTQSGASSSESMNMGSSNSSSSKANAGSVAYRGSAGLCALAAGLMLF